MPVTAGHVPGLTSNLRRVPTDPGRFRSGRWFLLAEGALVSAFGIAGLVLAALNPQAGPTGNPVLGLDLTGAHSVVLLVFGVAAVAAVSKRRAAITVTALSAVGYTMLLFFSAVATARTKPTPMGFHAADILLHGVLAVVNLALLMWLIPDELGDETWVRRRRRSRDRARPEAPPPESAAERAAPPATVAVTTKPSRPSPPAVARSPRPPNDPPVAARNEHSAPGVTNVTPEPPVPQRTKAPASLRGPIVALMLAAVVVAVFLWRRRR